MPKTYKERIVIHKMWCGCKQLYNDHVVCCSAHRPRKKRERIAPLRRDFVYSEMANDRETERKKERKWNTFISFLIGFLLLLSVASFSFSIDSKPKASFKQETRFKFKEFYAYLARTHINWDFNLMVFSNRKKKQLMTILTNWLILMQN